jgi:hypothetical protein
LKNGKQQSINFKLWIVLIACTNTSSRRDEPKNPQVPKSTTDRKSQTPLPSSYYAIRKIRHELLLVPQLLNQNGHHIGQRVHVNWSTRGRTLLPWYEYSSTQVVRWLAAAGPVVVVVGAPHTTWLALAGRPSIHSSAALPRLTCRGQMNRRYLRCLYTWLCVNLFVCPSVRLLQSVFDRHVITRAHKWGTGHDLPECSTSRTQPAGSSGKTGCNCS